MLRRNIVFLFVFCVAAISAVKFRFDYEFYQEADGWLKVHKVPQKWTVAMQICHAEGAVLASPLTTNLKEAIINHVLKYSSVQQIFTGVHSTFAKGVYTTVEGVPLARLPITWAPDEPDNYNDSENCLIMSINKNSNVKDDICWKVLPYVCYKKLENIFVNGCGTIDPEYIHDVQTGSCYKFHRRGLTWSKAFMTCDAEGGHLAIINSEKESSILGALFTKINDSEILSKNPHIASIGFREWDDEGFWMTIHGQTLSEAGFNRWWGKQGPDNYTRAPNFSSEICGSIVRSGVLNDVACDLALPFICEKKPNSLANFDDTYLQLSTSN